jgi:hypothetical protein
MTAFYIRSTLTPTLPVLKSVTQRPIGQCALPDPVMDTCPRRDRRTQVPRDQDVPGHPVNNNLIKAFVGTKVLGLPRSY